MQKPIARLLLPLSNSTLFFTLLLGFLFLVLQQSSESAFVLGVDTVGVDSVKEDETTNNSDIIEPTIIEKDPSSGKRKDIEEEKINIINVATDKQPSSSAITSATTTVLLPGLLYDDARPTAAGATAKTEQSGVILSNETNDYVPNSRVSHDSSNSGKTPAQENYKYIPNETNIINSIDGGDSKETQNILSESRSREGKSHINDNGSGSANFNERQSNDKEYDIQSIGNQPTDSIFSESKDKETKASITFIKENEEHREQEEFVRV